MLRRSAFATLLLLSGCAHARPAMREPDAAMIATARGIHERVLTIDTHVDINPANFRGDTLNYHTRRWT
jgi:hypothetical protein